jgi:myosin-crossreactive antigen
MWNILKLQIYSSLPDLTKVVITQCNAGILEMMKSDPSKEPTQMINFSMWIRNQHTFEHQNENRFQVPKISITTALTTAFKKWLQNQTRAHIMSIINTQIDNNDSMEKLLGELLNIVDSYTAYIESDKIQRNTEDLSILGRNVLRIINFVLRIDSLEPDVKQCFEELKILLLRRI